MILAIALGVTLSVVVVVGMLLLPTYIESRRSNSTISEHCRVRRLESEALRLWLDIGNAEKMAAKLPEGHHNRIRLEAVIELREEELRLVEEELEELRIRELEGDE